MDDSTRQLILTSTVLSAAVGGVLALLGSGLTAWFARDREERLQLSELRREQLAARREWAADRVRHTKTFLWGFADLLAASAAEDQEEFDRVRPIVDSARSLDGVDMDLMGDDQLASAFIEVAVEAMSKEPGERDEELAVRVIEVMNELDRSLIHQMNRAMSDEPLALISPELASDAARRLGIPPRPAMNLEPQREVKPEPALRPATEAGPPDAG